MSTPRSTTTEVAGVLGDNYGPNADGDLPDLTRWLRMATNFVTRVITCAAGKGITLSSEEAADIESAMAAHFYTKMDPTYSSRSTDGGSGSFVRDGKIPEPYKDLAQSLDPSGCVASLLSTQKGPQAYWLGKTDSEKLTYDERN